VTAFDVNDGAPEGATPIDPEEAEGRIDSTVQTKADLNEQEAQNISEAILWLDQRRSFDVLHEERLTALHRRMFDRTWRWAGQFRRTMKSVSPYHAWQVPLLARELVENAVARYDGCDKSANELDDIAMRFHHRLVVIHPFPNGNGRHARLATDELLKFWKRPAFRLGRRRVDNGWQCA
jgi:Fic-DOC domain mobile mystery protein B